MSPSPTNVLMRCLLLMYGNLNWCKMRVPSGFLMSNCWKGLLLKPWSVWNQITLEASSPSPPIWTSPALTNGLRGPAPFPSTYESRWTQMRDGAFQDCRTPFYWISTTQPILTTSIFIFQSEFSLWSVLKVFCCIFTFELPWFVLNPRFWLI